MTDQPIDPAATPQDDNAPDIAADDVGASGTVSYTHLRAHET